MMRIFKADSVAVAINKLDPARVADVSARTLAYIGAFANRFYPHLAPRLSLCTDETRSALELMERVVRPMAAELDLLPEMIELGRGRSSSSEAMAYGVAHAFYMGALLPRDGTWGRIWRGDVHLQQPEGVMCIGGKPERLFIRVMNLAAQSAHEQWRRPPRAHLITRLAQKPAYSCYPDEPRIDVAIAAEELEVLARHPWCGADWKALLKDPRVTELLEFIGEWHA
jgi:hypothetical protein